MAQGRGRGRQERHISRRETGRVSEAKRSAYERWTVAYVGRVRKWDVKDGDLDAGAEDGDGEACGGNGDDDDDRD